MRTLIRFFRWIMQKLGTALLIVFLGIGLYALALFLKDNVDFDSGHAERLAALSVERDHYRAAVENVRKRIGALQAEIGLQEARVKQAGRIMAQLKALESWWDRLVGNPVQQKANAEQIQRLEALGSGAREKVGELQRTLVQTKWEGDGLEIALAKVERHIAFTEANQSKVRHYLKLAWERVEWWVYAALVLYFIGPTAGKLLLFYGLAPLISSGRPVRLNLAAGSLPEVESSRVSLETALWPGERLWVKEKFLQTSDEGLQRRTRFVLDWRIPLTCAASGLIELVEIRNIQAGAEFRVTLSNHDNPHVELALIAIPEGGSLVLRPSFLAGIIKAGDSRLLLRRRWQLFRWQSWVTLQFRFFEFVGPCRLVVAGSRGVRAERLIAREGSVRPARRTNQDATIGFTPNLEYRPVRAETFWSYYRGMNPLFDDLFSGEGVFLSQETSVADDANQARRFWSTLWNGVLKVFGL